jgi:tetratricopeptide (TPR) repeat protein
LGSCLCGEDHGPEIEEAEAEARNAFAQCLRLAPAYAPAYEDLATFHLAANRRDEAVAVMHRLLEHAPDHLEALLFLGQHYATHGEPWKGREFVQRARVLKPLDRQVGDLLWSTHAGAARELARREQYDEARAELATADRLQPSRATAYDALARKAILETRAGNAEAARQFVEQAQEGLCEPTALWLVMAIEAIRHDLPREEVWLYEKRWQDALKRRCRSQTAGLMCQLMLAHRKHPQPYSQVEEHVQCLLKYVRRCSRVKWQAEDLRLVCEFLEEMKDTKLLTKFAKQGRRKFAEVGYFHCLTGLMEMVKGPYSFNETLTVECFRQAIQLASKSNDPRDERVVEMAKRGLSRVENAGGHFDDYEDEDDDYEDDFEEDVGRSLAGVSREELFDVLRALCERAGLDPEGVFGEMAGGGEKRTRRRGKRE